MDLSNPLASLLPINDSLVIRVLARLESPATGRQVHKLAGEASYSGIRLSLGRLTKTGLLTARRLDHAILYSVNREHLLWGPVEDIIDSRAKLVRMIRTALNLPGASVSVSFYGSVAREDSTASSDIDIALVYDDTAQRLELKESVDSLSEKVETWTGNACQVYDVTRDELRSMVRAEDPIVASWKGEAVTFIGPNLQALIGLARG